MIKKKLFLLLGVILLIGAVSAFDSQTLPIQGDSQTVYVYYPGDLQNNPLSTFATQTNPSVSGGGAGNQTQNETPKISAFGGFLLIFLIFVMLGGIVALFIMNRKLHFFKSMMESYKKRAVSPISKK